MKHQFKNLESLFYTFNQNNSGGYFVTDDLNGVGEVIIIEAVSRDHAKSRFKEIGDKTVDFWSSCPCCGDRWDTDYLEGAETPEIFGEPIKTVKKSLFLKRCYIHRIGGVIEKIELG